MRDHSDTDDPRHESRRVMRVPVHAVRCSQGRVVDLSTRGMRLVVPVEEQPVEGQSQHYELPTDSGSVRLSGTVCWVRQSVLDARVAEVGIVFDPLEAPTRDALVRLAMNHGSWTDADWEPSVRIEHENLYAVLGVDQDAGDDEIRRAYHALIKRWNPQLGDDPAAQTTLSAAHRAYAVLRNPDSRAVYDQRFAPRRDAA